MEQYIIAAAIATVAPGLLIKGITAGVSGAWYLTNRVVYGKQKSDKELLKDELKEVLREALEESEMKYERKLEERLLEIRNNERNINFKLDQVLKNDHDPNSKE